MNQLKKILLDSLTNRDGRYSRESLTWVIGVLLFVFLVVYGNITVKWAPEFVFWAVLTLVLGIAGRSTWNKIIKQNEKKTDGNESK